MKLELKQNKIMNDTNKAFDEITAEDIKNILAIDIERDKYWVFQLLK